MRIANRIVNVTVLVALILAGTLLVLKLTVLSPAAERSGDYLLERVACDQADLHTYGAADIQVAFSTGNCDTVAVDTGHDTLKTVNAAYKRLRQFGFPRLSGGTILYLNPSSRSKVVGSAGHARVGVVDVSDRAATEFEINHVLARLMISRAAPGLNTKDTEDLAQAVAWLSKPEGARWDAQWHRISEHGRRMIQLINRGGWNPVRYALSHCGQECSLLG